MKLAVHKFFLGLLGYDANEDEQDREDVECLQKARYEKPTFRPLRDVLSDIDAKQASS
jgi:hypothetical protein